MGIGSGTAMLIGGLASAGGSVASGIMGSNAAQNAAEAQAEAAEKAAQLQYQESQNALGFQENQWNTTQNELQPWLQSGTGALSNLNYLMGVTPQSAPGGAALPAPANITPNFGTVTPPGGAGPASTIPAAGTTTIHPQSPASGFRPMPLSGPSSNVRTVAPGTLPGVGDGMPTLQGTAIHAPSMFGGTSPAATPSTATSSTPGGFGSLMQPFGQTFTAPTAAEMEANDPGYQARMNLGRQAMEQSAAARGNLLTGGTAQAENQLAQDYASNEYNNFYNQSLGAYTTNYNAYNQGQANQFNRLAAMAGMGQTTAGQLGTLGQENANAMSNNVLTTGQMMGQDYQNAGAANASGIVGSANAYGGMASGLGNSISGMMNLSMLQNLLGGGGGSNVMPYSWLNGTADPLGLGGAS